MSPLLNLVGTEQDALLTSTCMNWTELKSWFICVFGKKAVVLETNTSKSLPSLHSPVSIRCAMSCPLCFHPDPWVCPPLCGRGRITLRSIRQLCMTPGLATRMYARHFLSNHTIMASQTIISMSTLTITDHLEFHCIFFFIYFVAFSKQVSKFSGGILHEPWWMYCTEKKTTTTKKKNPHLLSQLSVRPLNTHRVTHHCFILQLFKIGNSEIEWWEASGPCPCLSKGRLHDEEPAFLILCKRTCSLALWVNIH